MPSIRGKHIMSYVEIRVRNPKLASLRTADAFPVVTSLPPKKSDAIFGGREATTGNASAVRVTPSWPTSSFVSIRAAEVVERQGF